jgi:hypothetical protein
VSASVDPVVQLEASLADTAAALEAGDPVRAADASSRAAGACRAIETGGGKPPHALLLRARDLQARCEAASEVLQQKLVAEVERSARSRRAAAAYGDHG